MTENKVPFDSISKASSRPRPTVAAEGGIQVIGAGFSRTGTSTTQEALEMLGFAPCYHYRDVYLDPDGIDKWDRIGLGEEPDWDDVFFGYKAVVDTPAAMHYKKLMKKYPNAKVIMTIRDEEAWVDSALQTICRFHPTTFPMNFIYWITNTTTTKQRRMAANNIWIPFCGSMHAKSNRDVLLESYRKWNADVQASVPKEKLLVFSVKEGWEPLCKFLGVEVPKEPFPRTFESAHFKQAIEAQRTKALTRFFGGIAAIVVITSAAFFLTSTGGEGKAEL